MPSVTVEAAGESTTVAYTLAAPSFGPDGSHWPDRTPKPTDAMGFEVTAAACTWAAIKSAIALAVAGSGTNSNAVVWIPDGVLTGNGAGSTNTPVLDNVGALGRGKRILVYPKNGWGHVTTSASLRFNNVKGITIGGIDMGAELYGANTSGCEDFALVRMRGIAFNLTGMAGLNTQNVQFVELVTPTALLRDQDRWGWRTSSDANGDIRDIEAIGCYIAPAYRNAGSTSHCDSWQLSGQALNYYGSILYKDCAVFSSTNCGIQIGSAYDLHFEHVLAVGGTVTKRRYPVPAGGDTVPNGHAIGGGGQPNDNTITDSIVIGSMDGPTFGTVTNSRTDDVDFPAFTQDPSLTGWTTAQLDAAAPIPTTARLASIWS